MFRIVRHVFGWFLLGAYLWAGTPAAEVLKLPVLIEHYLEHRAEAPDMSFWEYLTLHYFSGIEYDADYARDLQLPFKSISLASVLLLALQPPFCEEWKLTLPSNRDTQLELPPVLGSPRGPYVNLPTPPPEA
ncbi:MAG: hypothetical protein NZM43_06565 [Saprospiraceae bacterium]|nr:hypothetical protein [Saprospiraceae bacterium]MDW8483974.1 hypothetical protein [Saprospiraceae bacterium]